jgi:hypothetical protein
MHRSTEAGGERAGNGDRSAPVPGEVDMPYVTTLHHEFRGGELRLVLTTDSPPTRLERERLDRITGECTALGPPRRDGACADVDEAIWELGGELAITAG